MPRKTILGLLTAAERQFLLSVLSLCFYHHVGSLFWFVKKKKEFLMFLMFRLFSKQVVRVKFMKVCRCTGVTGSCNMKTY